MKNIFFAFLMVFSFGIALFPAAAQSLPIGIPVAEELIRIAQLGGELDTKLSLMVRPLGNVKGIEKDSLSPEMRALLDGFAPKKSLLAKENVQLLPVTLRQQFNSHHPYGWNDGSIIPAKGLQTQLSFGVYAQYGPLTIQLRPEFVFAQNARFNAFPPDQNDYIWQRYYDTVLNHIDAPGRFGDGVYTKAFPGQSSIRLNLKKFSFGVSTENLWWGPGVRNSLLMTNNAPGFPHLTLNTSAPVVTPVGLFEGQLNSGLLKKSGYAPPDTNRVVNGRRLYVPKPAGDRYFNGMVVTWQPKWTKGLYLGFSRVFYTYRSYVEPSFNGYLPVISSFFKTNSPTERGDEKERDQMLSLFFRLLLPKEGFELYGEYGRNDHSGDMRDLLLQPEHSRAYVVGLKKLFVTANKTKVEVMSEFTNLQMPVTQFVREQQSWYSHYQVRDGYTNRGQVVGAGIGPGGSSVSFGINWFKGITKTGVLLERVVLHNDFYYHAFTQQRNFMSHWVDYSINLSRSWRHKHFLYDARLSWIKAMNYQWQQYKDVRNLHTGVSVSYLF